MTKTAPAKTAWTAPQLIKLGTIADVAGSTGSGGQAGPNARS